MTLLAACNVTDRATRPYHSAQLFIPLVVAAAFAVDFGRSYSVTTPPRRLRRG
jgi:hypothetical protein